MYLQRERGGGGGGGRRRFKMKWWELTGHVVSGVPKRLNVIDIDIEHRVTVKVQVASQVVVRQQTCAVD